MPSTRQIRAIGLVATLLVLIIYYVSHGASSTHNSPFYKNTVAAQTKKKTAAEREQLFLEEKDRAERVERLKKEHDAAILEASSSMSVAATAPTHAPAPVAGRKKYGDGEQKKIVQEKPKADKDDGVAKVGNVAPKESSVADGEQTEEDREREELERKVERELNDILKKGPIIVFSKTFCPFSKKAKHILLDLYSISPPPYVVELDEHPLGAGLQAALNKSTGRRTVPNVLINGRSIGGGDDVAALNDNDELISTIKSMGGKRIVSVEKVAAHLASEV